jgi:hypothetical protein
MAWAIRSENATSKRELDGIRSGMQSLKEMLREMEDRAEQEANAAEHARRRTTEVQVKQAPPIFKSFGQGMHGSEGESQTHALVSMVPWYRMSSILP